MWVVSLFILGVVLWGVFLNWGNIPFDFHDWAEVNVPRLAMLKDAVTKGVLPYHIIGGTGLRGLTDRFMCLPDVILSPQILLLLFLEVGPFVLVNTLLLYTVGFLGLLWFKRRFQLSPLIFAFLFMLFNFNGHILTHTSVGHITWGGYYLFPWFFALLFRLSDGERNWRWSVEMALVLFLTMLQGSFHHFVWEGLFLVIFGLATLRKHWQPLLKALVFAALFNMVRFLPPTLLLGQFDTDFYGGYPRPWQILTAMVRQVIPKTAQPFLNFSSNLGYWEFDLYISWAGVLFLAMGLILGVIKLLKNRSIPPFVWPIISLIAFSIWKIYLPITKLPIPMLNGERVTSRMIILPLVLCLILSSEALQGWIDRRKFRLFWGVAGLLGLGYLTADLVIRRVWRWQVLKAFSAFPNTPVDLSRIIVTNHSDPPYTTLFLIGLCVTVISLAVAGFLVWREKKS